MKKNTKETIWAILILAAVFGIGLGIGQKVGFNEGIEVNHGDKWDCAYSHATGFLMCNRTPKYK